MSLKIVLAAMLASSASSVAVVNENCSNSENYYVKNQKNQETNGGFSVTLGSCEKSNGDLTLAVNYESDTHLRVKIERLNGKNWEIPEAIAPILNKSDGSAPESPQYAVTMNGSKLIISREEEDEILMNLDIAKLNFKERIIYFENEVGEDNFIMGLGERIQDQLEMKDDYPYTLWNIDQYSTPLDMNLYGAHPYYVDVKDNGKAHSVFLRNSHGQEWRLQKDVLSAHVLGGILDFFIFVGPSIDEVGQQYADLVGRSFFPPYWALGYQQSRYGSENVSAVEHSFKGFEKANIPLEVMYTDIDYMNLWRDFTNDPVHYPIDEWKSLVKDIHDTGRKYIIIKDPAIAEAVGEGYAPYDKGTEMDVFVKHENGQPYRARQWVGDANVIDPSAANAFKWWSDLVVEWRNETGIPFDGMWIDMNEFANFCHGESNTKMPAEWQKEYGLLWSFPCWAETQEQKNLLADMTWEEAKNYNWTNYGETMRVYTDSLNNPEFNLWNSVGGETKFKKDERRRDDGNEKPEHPLTYKTLDMTAEYANGANQYEMHNIYGLAITRMGVAALEDAMPSKRPFLLTRSTFPGSGSLAGHWTGDVAGNWLHMHAGINLMIQSQIVGNLYIGDDLCGFVNEDSIDEEEFTEMCARWMSIGSFYPFTRNHYGKGHPMTNIHEPWQTETVADASRFSLNAKYEILPYFYTLFHDAHQGTGAYVLRSLMFDYPTDKIARNTTDQFLVGHAIMLAPVVEYKKTSRSVYFPDDSVWYHWRSGIPVGEKREFESRIDTEDVILMFGKGGSIVPTQGSENTIDESRQNDMVIVAMANGVGSAEGKLYWDSGDQVNISDSFEMTYNLSNGTFTSKVERDEYSGSVPKISEIKIYGVEKEVKVSATSDSGNLKTESRYDSETKVLNVFIDISVNANFQLSLN
eukprot:Awhi_evm1s10972